MISLPFTKNDITFDLSFNLQPIRTLGFSLYLTLKKAIQALSQSEGFKVTNVLKYLLIFYWYLPYLFLCSIQALSESSHSAVNLFAICLYFPTLVLRPWCDCTAGLRLSVLGQQHEVLCFESWNNAFQKIGEMELGCSPPSEGTFSSQTIALSLPNICYIYGRRQSGLPEKIIIIIIIIL